MAHRRANRSSQLDWFPGCRGAALARQTPTCIRLPRRQAPVSYRVRYLVVRRRPADICACHDGRSCVSQSTNCHADNRSREILLKFYGICIDTRLPRGYVREMFGTGRANGAMKTDSRRQRSTLTTVSQTRPFRTLPISRRVAEVSLHFGLGGQVGGSTVGPVGVVTGPGRLVALVGPSGSGKSSVLSELMATFPGACHVQQAPFPLDRSVIDAVASRRRLDEALSLITGCGLGEARLWVRPFDSLSDGEKFRARLARAVGLQLGAEASTPLLCDEFCSGLHRRVARAISYNLRKLTSRRKLNVVVATSNEDVLTDLQPDQVIRLATDCTGTSIEQSARSRTVSFRRRLRIERGTKRDYDAFSAMHYRAAEELGFVDRVYVLRDGAGGEHLGIVVYAHGPLELSLRNVATRGRFKGNPRRLNSQLRILRRLVVHPDVRGCGLGHFLVRRTLPMLRKPFVECLAGMGTVNPVFEKAGMQRIGCCPRTPGQREAHKRLTELGVDPLGPEFVAQVCRRPRVRRLVTDFVTRWYTATTAAGAERTARQSPQFLARTFRGLIGSRPVYYLWHHRGQTFDTVTTPEPAAAERSDELLHPQRKGSYP